MAKKGRYSDETKKQGDLFVDMLGGNLEDAFGMSFERAEMFWDEVESGERDRSDAEKAVLVSNYLANKISKNKK
jgi:hypothetical protein